MLLLPQHGQDEPYFSLLHDGAIRSFSAPSFPSPVGNSEIRLQYALDEDCVEADIDTAVVNPSTGTLVVEVRHNAGFISSSTAFLFHLGTAAGPPSQLPPTITLVPLSTALPKRCRHFLGFSEAAKSFVFLHRNSWVSSATLLSLVGNSYSQHFFVPNDYLHSNDGEVLPVKTAADDVVFCLHGELVAVRNGLKFQAVKVLE